MAPRSPRGPSWRRAFALFLPLALVVGAASCGVEVGGDLAASVGAGNPDVLGNEDVTTTEPEAPPTTLPPPTDLDIEGAEDSEVNAVAANAIVDLEDFWATAFPEAYDGEEYEKLSGGLFAVDSGTDPQGLPCDPESIDAVLQNAYYCPPDDAVVWDQEGLLPDLSSRYGDFTVAVVLAHEWGHAIQERAAQTADPDLAQEPTVVTELQADCFAGAWVRHVTEADGSRFEVNTDQLDQSLAGILSLRDAPGSSAEDPNAHGSGFDRVGGFQEGFEEGVTRCAEYTEGDPAPYQFPFTSEADLQNGGDLPLEGTDPTDDPGITDLVFPSLDAYWTDTFPEISGGEEWDPMGEPVRFTADDPPECNGNEVSDYSLFICIPDRYVGFDLETALSEAYDQNGDFGVATLFATQYGLDIADQLGGEVDDVTATLRADCYAGSWTAAILPPDPPEDYQLILSPGDLDEAVAVLLAVRSEADRARTGPGFDRVRAFRRGVLSGAEECAEVAPS